MDSKGGVGFVMLDGGLRMMDDGGCAPPEVILHDVYFVHAGAQSRTKEFGTGRGGPSCGEKVY